MTARPIRLLLPLACAFVLAGCAGSTMYVGTTWGAPWGGVTIGTAVPIGYPRPCCWEDDTDPQDDDTPDDAPAHPSLRAPAKPHDTRPERPT